MSVSASNNDVVIGARVNLSGQIISVERSCEDFEIVQIRRRVHGTESETELLDVLTDADGVYSVDVRARESADYRAVVAGSDRCAGGSSSPVSVEVRVKVRIGTRDRSVPRGSEIRIVATVIPAHQGTRVVLQRKKGRKFVRVAAGDVDGDGRAVFRLDADWRGDRIFRARWPAQDDDHGSNLSWGLEIHTER